LSTGKKKIKIELEDDDGGRYNLSLEGNLSKDKIQKVLQLVESLNISKEENSNLSTTDYGLSNNTLKNMSNTNHNQNNNNHLLNSIESKVWTLIQNNFAFSSFTSSNVADSYESNYGDQLQLSLISTYLSRYYEKGKLTRVKRGKEWLYKLIRVSKDLSTDLVSQDIQSNSSSTHLINSQYSLEHQNDENFLKHNVLSTVYDLHL
jgi:predicted transcriptional regulator